SLRSTRAACRAGRRTGIANRSDERPVLLTTVVRLIGLRSLAAASRRRVERRCVSAVNSSSCPSSPSCFRGSSSSVRKLLQKPEIVLVEQPDVLDLVPQDRDTLDADAPREAGVFLGVVAHRLE